MSFKANAKHHAALILISLGAVSVLGVAVGVAVTMTGREPAVGVVCCLVSAAMGFFLIRGGLRMRKRAIEAGSTAHIEGGGMGDVHTSYTGTAKPSFLRDSQRPERRSDVP
jgi:hypothetical protein